MLHIPIVEQVVGYTQYEGSCRSESFGTAECAHDERVALEHWIGSYDTEILSSLCPQKGLKNFHISLLCTRFHIDMTVRYYEMHPNDRVPDLTLCLGICPLFVLHGCATQLRTDADAGQATHELLLALHVLKQKLVASGRDVAAFLARIFALIEHSRVKNKVWGVGKDAHNGEKERNRRVVVGKDSSDIIAYPHLLVVVVVFMTSNLHFVVERLQQTSPSGHYATQYYPCCTDIKRAGALEWTIVTNLLSHYIDDNERNREFLVAQMRLYSETKREQWCKFYRQYRRSGGVRVSSIEAIIPEKMSLYVPRFWRYDENGDGVVSDAADFVNITEQ